MLLYNELPTAFPWYDKIGKQQRYRENAAKMCDYRLLNPRDRLLPFQFKIDYLKGNNMVDMENDLIEGEYLGTVGATHEDETGIRTGFVPVTGGQTIFYRTGMVFAVFCAFFNNEYQFISEHRQTSTTGSVTVPPNAAFAIFNVSSSHENQLAVFTDGHLTTSGTSSSSSENWRRSSILNLSNMFQVTDDSEDYFYTGILIPASPSPAGIVFKDDTGTFTGVQFTELKSYEREPVIINPGTRYMGACSHGSDPIIEKRINNRPMYNKTMFSVSAQQLPANITPGNIVSWKIMTCCGSETDVTNNIGLISLRMYGDGIRVLYKGEPMFFETTAGNKPLSIQPGAYYSVIEFENGYQYFSEVFTVPEDSLDNYMKIEFWNSCDIEPIAYNDGAGGWKQTIYIDSFIHASDPEVEEDGERDGNDMLIPTFQRMVVRYRFSAVVPDYMKIAIVSLQLHDNVLITTENETRSGRADRISTSTSIDDNGAYSTIDAIIDQYVMVKKACCRNIDLIDMP